MNRSQIELYKTRFEAGLCVRCGLNNDRSPKQLCQYCASKHNTSEKNRSIRYRQTSQCMSCGGKTFDGNSLCEKHLQRDRVRTKAWWHKLKIEVLNQYGGCFCIMCPEQRLGALTIDHISGGGQKHRDEIKSRFYLWLKQHQFPHGFRVLCSNCNIKQYLIKMCENLSASRDAIRTRKANNNIKIEFMNKFGAKCSICATEDLDVLTVHHINNDGVIHRKLLGTGGGARFYRAILKSNDFAGLECRCFNCNDNEEWANNFSNVGS